MRKRARMVRASSAFAGCPHFGVPKRPGVGVLAWRVSPILGEVGEGGSTVFYVGTLSSRRILPGCPTSRGFREVGICLQSDQTEGKAPCLENRQIWGTPVLVMAQKCATAFERLAPIDGAKDATNQGWAHSRSKETQNHHRTKLGGFRLLSCGEGSGLRRRIGLDRR